MASMLSTGISLAANISSGNVLGSISSGLALVNQLDSFLNDSDIEERQQESYKLFEEAVQTFKKTVEDYSLGEKISFGKLEKPSNLVTSNITSSGGGGSVLGGRDPSNANIDTSKLKQQLNQAGYTDLAKQVDSIFAGYAQYGKLS